MFEQPPLSTLSNIEIEEFIPFSQFDGLYFLFGLLLAFFNYIFRYWLNF